MIKELKKMERLLSTANWMILKSLDKYWKNTLLQLGIWYYVRNWNFEALATIEKIKQNYRLENNYAQMEDKLKTSPLVELKVFYCSI